MKKINNYNSEIGRPSSAIVDMYIYCHADHYVINRFCCPLRNKHTVYSRNSTKMLAALILPLMDITYYVEKVFNFNCA